MDLKQQSEVSEKANENASEFVTGQKLEKQSEQVIESDNEVLWVSLVCLFLMLLGSFYQVRFRSLSY
jgi:hypothetical protein